MEGALVLSPDVGIALTSVKGVVVVAAVGVEGVPRTLVAFILDHRTLMRELEIRAVFADWHEGHGTS